MLFVGRRDFKMNAWQFLSNHPVAAFFILWLILVGVENIIKAWVNRA